MTRVTTLSRIILLLTVTVSVKDVCVSALAIVAPWKVIAVNGGTATFRISYALESFETFTRLWLKKDEVSVFEAAYYLPPNPPNSDGVFHGVYASRGSTDYSHGKTNFTISLSHVTPDDEGQYTVYVSIVGGTSKSSFVLLVEDYPPGKPSITGAPTQSVLGGAGPTVLTCTANLGKPQAAMVWSRRIGNAAYTNVTENGMITATNNTGGTTSGTSRLAVNLDIADDGVQFRCTVSNRQASLSVKTQPIKVTAPSQQQEQGLTGGAIAAVVISLCSDVILLLVLLLVVRKTRVTMIPGFRGNKYIVRRPRTNRQTQLSSYQTRGTSMRVSDVTSTEDTVDMELKSTGCRELTDEDVMILLESLGLKVYTTALERGQGTTNSLQKLSIEDLISRLAGVPLGPNGIILEKVGKTG